MGVRVWLVFHVLVVFLSTSPLAGPHNPSQVDGDNPVTAARHDNAKGPVKGPKSRPPPRSAKGAKGRPKRGPKGARKRPPPKGARKGPPSRPRGGKVAPRGKTGPRGGRPKPYNSGKKRPPQRSRGKAGKFRPKSRMRPRLNETKRQEYEEKQHLQFKMIDADEDGKLTSEEVLAVQADLTAKYDKGDAMEDTENYLRKRMERKDWMNSADTDKDGHLTLEEFQFLRFKSPEARKKDFEQKQEVQFKLMDADGDGQVTSEEVLAAKTSFKAKRDSGEQLQPHEGLLLRRMAREGWKDKADANKDGWLSLDEFRFVEKKKPVPKPQEL